MIVENLLTFINKIMYFSSYVKNTSSFAKPLTPEEEQMYLEKYNNGDEKARDILISHNLRLVAHIVKKFKQADETDDLISVGSLGLIKAINTYKMGMGTQFSTYAARCIENEILMLLRVNKKHKNTISVEDILCSDEDENEVSVIDLAYEGDNDVEKQVDDLVTNQKLDKILKEHLTKREYIIMTMRYGLRGKPALTQREVAKELNISRSYVSRLEKKSIEILRKYITEDEFR